MPSLCADPGVPKHLIDAGVRSPLCRAVVVLSDGEENNLRITTMARVLNPDLPILCRSTSPEYGARLAELDSITVINPFEIFAQLLVLAITAPKLHNLNAFLVRAKGVKLGQALEIPVGDWILCGYGRMGQWLHHYLERQGIHPVVIDPDMEKTQGPSRVIHGYASQQTLLAAGIEHAAGVVAGTPSDHSNLEILMCVHALRRDAFTILRQNNHENQPAFDLADAKLVLQSSQTTARRILKHLISPQAQRLIDHLEMKGEAVTGGLVERLRLVLGEKAPHLWRVTLRAGETGAAVDWMQDGGMLKLGELLRNPYERLEKIACIPLAIKRGETNMMLPDDDEMLCLGDEILLCGTQGCETLLSASLNNPYTLHYLLTGKDAPRGYVFRWFASWRARSAEASS